MTKDEHAEALIGSLGYRNVILLAELEAAQIELARRQVEEVKADTILYGRPDCGPCVTAENLLIQQGVKYQKVLVREHLLEAAIKQEIGRFVSPLLYEKSTGAYKIMVNGGNGFQWAAVKTKADEEAA